MGLNQTLHHLELKVVRVAKNIIKSQEWLPAPEMWAIVFPIETKLSHFITQKSLFD